MPDQDPPVRVCVLGPVLLERAGTPTAPGPPKQRALLAALALRLGSAVPVDALADLLWGDEVPGDVNASLHTYVAGLRRLLEPDRGARSPSALLVTTDAGYALRLPAAAIDAGEFAERVGRASARSASLPPEDLLAELDAALALWRGTPYAELGEAAEAERARLAELRLLALEERAAALLALGRHAAAAPELAALVHEHPLRERLWELHVTALARSQRQAEALEALREVRRLLRDELGVDPGPALQRLEAAVLRQDPAVAPPPAAPASPPAPSAADTPMLQRHADPAASAGSMGVTASPAAPAGQPLIGRERELTALIELLRQSVTSGSAAAALLGEPGIGKSRLVQEVTARAVPLGYRVLLGRCAEDEAAPPLWPWTGVLRRLAEEQDLAGLLAAAGVAPGDVLALVDGAATAAGDREVGAGAGGGSGSAGPAPGGSGSGSGSGERFRTYDAVARLLAAGARTAPLLVVLEDLHWADASSLRLLRHLLETVDVPGLVVLVTRRARPEPAGAQAEAAEVLARRGALRLDLQGLDEQGTAAFVAAATGEDPAPGVAAALQERSDGNPFFLAELVRLGPSAAGDVPAAVGDVVRRRVAQLPESCQDVLRTAAVAGRDLDLPVLATVLGADAEALDEDAVLAELERAQAAGLVVEDAPERFRFAHALTREALYASVPPTQRARRHARLAAVLEPAVTPDRFSEVARHWLRAGPRHARQAWQAARRAAEHAGRLNAHDEAAGLLADAVRAQADDRGATDRERYDLWFERARAATRAGDVAAATQALHEALALARRLDDVELLARAAIAPTDGALWTPRAYGTTDAPTLDALQEVLDRLGNLDSPLRCRALIARAAELQHTPHSRALREALVEQGLAVARRLGDPVLVGRACQAAAVALWWSGNARDRIALATEAVDAARGAGDEAWLATALVLRANAAAESGQVEVLQEDAAAARAVAQRLRLPYPLTVLGTLESAWLAMQGRFPEAERLSAATADLAERTAVPHRAEALMSARGGVLLWQGRAADVLPFMSAASGLSIPSDAPTVLMLLRSGHVDGARERMERDGLPLDTEDFLMLFRLAVAAEAALVLKLPALGAAVYTRLLPYADHVATAGSGIALGPVSAFLALAAASTGELATASRHAAEALDRCTRWGLGPVAAWLDEHRERARF